MLARRHELKDGAVGASCSFSPNHVKYRRDNGAESPDTKEDQAKDNRPIRFFRHIRPPASRKTVSRSGRLYSFGNP